MAAPMICGGNDGVGDGTRTRDYQNHNLVFYH
jgi:hypothetical protein